MPEFSTKFFKPILKFLIFEKDFKNQENKFWGENVFVLQIFTSLKKFFQ